MSKEVTCVLNGFRRPNRLLEQYYSVLNQKNIEKIDIMYWQNTMPGVNYSILENTTTAISNRNLGVWSRFYYALNAKTDWICIFDDDTIPGKLWLSNCLETVEKYPGLLGTIGVIFPAGGEYHNVQRFGWDNPIEETKQVDIVGHAWFFHRDLLSVFCRELPSLDEYMNVGEDIHFSHMIQKYTKYNTYVPPHPINKKELWGSLYGWEYGDDGNATASSNMHIMRQFLEKSVKNGFRLINNNV